jgi:hypothetical protein
VERLDAADLRQREPKIEIDNNVVENASGEP